MSSSNQISDDKIKCNDGTAGRFSNRTLKLFSPKFKLDSILKPELFKLTSKTIMLAKEKSSHGKPGVFYTYKVQKLVHFGRKKPKSPRMSKKTSKSKKPKNVIDEDFPTLKNDDADLTPRNRDEGKTIKNGYESATQNDDDFDFDFGTSDDIETSDDIKSIDDFEMWHSVEGQVTLTMVSKSTENQTTVNASWKELYDKKLEKQSNDSSQDTALIRYDPKTFRSQQTSTSDLFKFIKLSPFASTILQKCHELEEMQFNSFGSSFPAIPHARFPTLPEKNPQKSTMKMSQDSSDNKLCVYNDKPQDLFPTREPNPNSFCYWINPISFITFLGLLILIVEVIYIRFQMRSTVRPPFWRQFLNNFANPIYFH